MAGMLDFDGVNDLVIIPTATAFSAGGTYLLKFKGVIKTFPSSGIIGIIGTAAGSNSNGFLMHASEGAGGCRMYAAGVSVFGSGAGAGFIEIGADIEYSVEHDGTTNAYVWKKNGVAFKTGTYNGSGSVQKLDQFGKSSGTSTAYLHASLDTVHINAGGNTHTWRASLSGGTGSSLPTDEGTNTGVLTNFPTNDSQWSGFGAAAAEFACSLASNSTLTSQLQIGNLFQSNLFSESYVFADIPAAVFTFESSLLSESTLQSNIMVGSLFELLLVSQSEIAFDLIKPAIEFTADLNSESTINPDLVLSTNFVSTLISISEVSASISGVAANLNVDLLSESTVNINLLAPIYFAAELSNASTIVSDVVITSGLQAFLGSESSISSNILVPATFYATLNGSSTTDAVLFTTTYFSSGLINESALSANLIEGSVATTLEVALAAYTNVFADLLAPKEFNITLHSSSELFSDLYSIGGAIGGWDIPIELFSEENEIKEIALTFDQLGRPLVFYRVGADQLYLYWFNPSTLVNEIRFVGVGTSPVAGFDLIDDTSDSTSDVMLFYVRNDTAFMRIQRESYDIEHNSGVTRENMRLTSSGMRVDNRFQVVYTYTGMPQLEVTPENPVGTIPDSPEPPINPEDPGLPENQTPIVADYVYGNTGYNSGSLFVANTVLINSRDSFKLGFNIVSTGLGRLNGGLSYYHIFGMDTYSGFSRNLVCMAYVDHKLNRLVFLLWRSTSSVTYRFELKNTHSLIGEWEFEFAPNNIYLNLNGFRVAEDWISSMGSFTEKTRVTFGGYRQVLRGDSLNSGSISGSGFSFDGVMKNCWIEHTDYGNLFWPINEYNSNLQSSNPLSEHKLEIVNHKITNWMLVPE